MSARKLAGSRFVGIGALILLLALAPGAGGKAPAPGRGSGTPEGAEDRIRRIEAGDPLPLEEDGAPLRLDLRRIMELLKVPGLSVAVIDDFEIAWARGYGVARAGTADPVTPGTLFQAGSISKTVTAAGALRLVERRRLSLDEDVNRRLSSWKLPENDFTKEKKVTLRRILSHTAGLTVHGFPGYAVDEPRPSLLQVLDGEPPATTAPVRVDRVPGSEWRYSGGGVLIEQQMMIDAAGETFPRLMRDLVFDRIGMRDSTFEQPLPAERASLAASGTYASGKTVRGDWHVYPEMAAGGLWTTPSDLARFAIEIALSKRGKANRVISEATTREMLAPQPQRVGEIALGNREHPDRMGLGFFLGDAARPDLFGHIGDDEGFQAMLVMFADSGKGAVIMANSDNGILLGDHLLLRIAKEYGWRGFVPSDRRRIGAGAALLLVVHDRGAAAAPRALEEIRKAGSTAYPVDRETLIGVGYDLFGEGRLKDALEVLKLEVREYPEYWNAYDSLGEMYVHAGETGLAIENYKRSIELNPSNRTGQVALENLTRDSPP